MEWKLPLPRPVSHQSGWGRSPYSPGGLGGSRKVCKVLGCQDPGGPVTSTLARCTAPPAAGRVSLSLGNKTDSCFHSQSIAQCHHPACWLGGVTPQVTTTLSSLPRAWRVRRWVRDDTEHPPSIAPSPEQELIEELPDDSPPEAILANCLIAVGNLSTMTPALEPELETHLLRAALHAVFTLSMEKDPTQVQDLHRVLPDILDAMLGNLLAESPGTNRLHYILEHINYWIVPRVSRERARALRSSMALLRSTITLPAFDDSGH
ncbi:uncharacterized protein LOC122462543 [Chelonia mydas]|uniref:uncharacterized protein LOC122462543 n=1 Tax=Chelonia mydas TaxID=8469 RepID=UPI001CA9535D|nr:uncharacterized protein LOC122462543 [Chelonia mydas]